MKKYFADTNFYLRFILQDNKQQADQVEIDLKQAKLGRKSIIFLSAVFLEMAFVLLSHYAFKKTVVADRLLTLAKTSFLEIEDREIWIKILPVFAKTNISLLDIFLFEKAKEEKAEVLTFDQDFKKLNKLS